ncbi:MAG: oligosaccharide flippase family protein [Pyrinomonadaceae bacterium]
MSETRSETPQSIARNLVYGFSTWILPIGLSFIATPRIVKGLGDEDYGIYALVLVFVGYSFNFSFGRSIVKYVAEYRSSGENEKIAGMFSAACFISVLVGLASAAIIWLSSEWLVKNAFKISAESQGKTISALYVTSVMVFVLMQNQVLASVLQGIHRFDVYSKILNLNNILLITGNLVLALTGFGLVSFFIWNLTVISLSGLLFAISSKRCLPDLKFTWNFSFDEVKLIIFFSAGIIGAQILTNIIMIFERSWVTRQLGSEALTYYVIPLTLAFYIHAFVGSLVIVIFPLASELRNEIEKLLRLYTKATKMVCLIVAFFATSLIAEGYLFLTLWMGVEFAEKGYALLALQTIAFSFLAIQTVSWQLNDGLGYSRYNFYLLIICLLISITLMILLEPYYGAGGIAFARMTGLAAVFLSIFYIEYLFFNKTQVVFWLRITAILAVASACSATVEYLIIINMSSNWPALIAATSAGGAVFGLVIWLLNFISDDEKQLISRILTLGPKNR